MDDLSIAADAVAQLPELEPVPCEEQPDYSAAETTEIRGEWTSLDGSSEQEDRIEFHYEVMDSNPTSEPEGTEESQD